MAAEGAEKKPRILMLGPSLRSRGGIASCSNILMENGLQRLCHVKYIPTTVDGSKIQKALAGVRAFVCFWRALGSCDIVHVHFSYGVSMRRKALFIKYAHLASKKVILHSHSSEMERVLLEGSPSERASLQRFLVGGDAVVVMSRYWRDLLDSRLALPDGLVEVVPNGIAIQDHAFLSSKDGELNVLYLGRLEDAKGIDILLKGLASMEKQPGIPRMKLVLAGTGLQEDLIRYERLADKLVSECVFFGWADEDAKCTLFKQSDLLILPSRREVFPVVLLEAMSRGVPCVASDCGSIPEIIEDGVSGVTFKAGDVDSFAEKASSVFKESSLRRQYAEIAYEKVRKEYDITSVIGSLAGLYRRVLDE